jgi:type I restriction enzyme S subunit
LNVSVNDFFAIKLPLPPLPEQQAIAAVLTSADREIELLTRELEQQRQIKKYLMQQLLTGRIRTKGVNV